MFIKGRNITIGGGVPPLPTEKISVFDADGETITSFETLASLLSYLSTAVMTGNTTVQFNTSDIYYVPDGLNIHANTAIDKRLIFKGGHGVRPVFHGQDLPASVVNVNTNYVTYQNLTLTHADIENSGGCIVRANASKGCSFVDIVYDWGYCAMRATDDVQDLYIEKSIVKNTQAGSFRLGNGINIYPDIQRITIKDTLLDDSNLIEGNIPSTSLPYFGGFILKHCAGGLLVENSRSVSGNFLGMGDVESSIDVVIKNMIGKNYYIIGCENITLINCLLPESSYFTENKHLTLVQSFLNLNIHNHGSIDRIEACIFTDGIGGNVNLTSDLPQIERNNVLGKDYLGNYIHMSVTGVGPYNVNDGNLADYKLTKGQNTVFLADNSLLKLNPDKSLQPDSAGKDNILAIIDGINYDCMNQSRTLPTDPGAWK